MSLSGGGVEAGSRNASPGSLKRKRESPAPSRSRASPSEALKSARLTNGATSLSGSQLRTSTTLASEPTKQYLSPDSDEVPQSDSGDLLRGVGSASSLTSTASSVFSHNSHAHAQNKRASLANGLTPLTNHTNSSPPKGSSPHNSKSATAMATSNGVYTTSHAPASKTTPEPSALQNDRTQMLPPPGKAKGYRVVWDPELDNKLSKEERKRATPRKKEFGTEVRYIFHHLLSLHKIIHIT